MNLPVLSYTFLNTYDICPKQAFHRYVSKDLPYTPATTQMKWGRTVHDAFKERLNNNTPLPPECAKYESYVTPIIPLKPMVEVKVGIKRDGTACDFFDPAVWLRGLADVAAKREVSGLLFDWKTGGSKYESPYELELQALLISPLWPEVEYWTGRYVWLQEGRLGRPHDVSNVGETLEVLQDKAAEIEANRAKGYWPKKQSPLCSWCPVKSCEFNANRG